MANTVFIDVPQDFSFRSTVYSHGWCELAPFNLDTENWRLSYVFVGQNNVAIPAVIFEENGKIRIDLLADNYNVDNIVRDVRHLLRLDDDLDGFYNIIHGHERLNWVAEHRAGRMLRSPTVFEDLVKTICTTNCSWALTKIMVGNLVEKLGEAADFLSSSPAAAVPAASAAGTIAATDNAKGTQTVEVESTPPAHAGGTAPRHAFPTAATMASMDEDFYRTEIRAGYRSPYFVELAEAVASGQLDPEQWLTSDLPTAELKKEMKRVKGVGDYAAENLLKLVGRYDGLALDSWLRSQFYKNHAGGKKCDDKKIEKHYRKFGQWRALVIWCDMTEKWITE